MPPKANPIHVAERLLALTYALGEAAGRGDSAEMHVLFSERAKLLTLVETLEASPELLELLRKVQAAEVEVQGRFQQSKAEAVRDMQKGLHGKKVPGAYATRSGLRAVDFSG